MMKLERKNRIDYPEDHTFAIIVITLAVCMLFGGGFFYWYNYRSHKTDYGAVYVQLEIPQLPMTIERQPQIQSRLDQLSREPCYKDAIIGLSEALLKSGYPRESAKSVLSFAKRCGGSEALLPNAYDALVKISDFSAALHVADELVKSDPARARYRYMRAQAFEYVKDFEHALSDYINSLQLLGEPSHVAGSQFYDISRMYTALGRYCDAITPIETFIAFQPATRRTTQTTKIIAEYAEKGNCDAYYARGAARMALPGATGTQTLQVALNGVSGNFLLDTGATYVAVTSEFAAKARITTGAATQLPIKTVGGAILADLGYATTIAAGSAEARSVAVAVIRGIHDPFGSRLDGLLGMSFLARFNVRLSQNGIELTAIPLR